MTAEEQGLYRNLLDEVWLRDDHVIPDDRRILARVSGDPEAWARSGDKVLLWMKRVKGGWTHSTALEVIGQSVRRAENQRRYRLRRDNAAGNTTDNGADNKPDSPSPSPSLSVEMRNQYVGRPDSTADEPAVLPAVLSPSNQTEKAIRDKTDAMRAQLYALIHEMVDADPKHRDPTELMRIVTGYDKQDGRKVKGVVNAALLTFERLEKSIEDAKWHLDKWRKDGQGQRSS